MSLQNWVKFSCDVLQPYIATCAACGITFANAQEPVMYETRNIPVASLVPANVKGVDPEPLLGIIKEALEEHGFKTDITIRNPAQIEPWMHPYAVFKPVKSGKFIVLSTDDMNHLNNVWPAVTEKALQIASSRGRGEGGVHRAV